MSDVDVWKLHRFAQSPMGTFGRLMIPAPGDPDVSLFTVERPWRNNEPFESCIPAGVYELAPRRYNRGGYDAIEVLDVPDRTHVLIHVANTMNDVQGCIGPGLGLGFVADHWAVTNSRSAFNRTMEIFGALVAQAVLDIRWTWGVPGEA